MSDMHTNMILEKSFELFNISKPRLTQKYSQHKTYISFISTTLFLLINIS